MGEIKPSELSLFENYLLDLQKFMSDGEKDTRFFNRWQSRIGQITEIVNRLDNYLSAKDSEAAHQVERSKRLDLYSDEFTEYKKHIPYYLTGIKTYKGEVEMTLLQGDLLDKKVQEMTGLEFKTLLVAVLKEYQDRQQ